MAKTKNPKPPAAAKPAPAPTDNGAAAQPSIRVFTRWTPALIYSAEAAADGGNLVQAARICEWLLADDTIRGCLSARINSLLGMVPQFEKSGDRRRAQRAINALEAEEDFCESYPEQELWLMLAWGLLLGIAPMRHQPRYDDDHGGRLLPCPEFWHPAAGMRWNQLTGTWVIQVATSGVGGGIVEETIVPGDGTWVLHTPFGKHRPQSLGLWRCLAWWKLLKDMGRSDWARHMEQGSMLVLTQTAVQQNAPGQLANTKQQRNDNAASLYQRGRNAVAALAVGEDLKLLEAAGQAHLLYKAAADQANEAFAVAIRGGNLTTNVQGGSKSAAEVQERTGDFVNLRFDAESLASTLHNQSLTWWAQWNFGDAGLAPWPDYPVAPQRNLKNLADEIFSFSTAVQALELRGFEVDRQAAIEEFELQEWLSPGKKPTDPVMPPPDAAGPNVAQPDANTPPKSTADTPATPEQKPA